VPSSAVSGSSSCTVVTVGVASVSFREALGSVAFEGHSGCVESGGQVVGSVDGTEGKNEVNVLAFRDDVDAGSKLRRFEHCLKHWQVVHLRPATAQGQPGPPDRRWSVQVEWRLQSQHADVFLVFRRLLGGSAATASSVGFLRGLSPRGFFVLGATRVVAVRPWRSRSESSECTTMSCDVAVALATIKSAVIELPSPAPSLLDGLGSVMSNLGFVLFCFVLFCFVLFCSYCQFYSSSICKKSDLLWWKNHAFEKTRREN
jgi:hypothetical protein